MSSFRVILDSLEKQGFGKCPLNRTNLFGRNDACAELKINNNYTLMIVGPNDTFAESILIRKIKLRLDFSDIISHSNMDELLKYINNIKKMNLNELNNLIIKDN